MQTTTVSEFFLLAKTVFTVLGVVVGFLIAYKVVQVKVKEGVTQGRAEEYKLLSEAKDARIEELTIRVSQLEENYMALSAKYEALADLKSKEIAVEVALLLGREGR